MKIESKASRLLPGVLAVIFALVSPSKAAQVNTYSKLEITSDDLSFSARITGRIQVDGNFYHSTSDDKQIPSGTFVRRARIGIQGNFREYEYEVDFDNATSKANLRNAKLARVFGPGKFTVGQFKVSDSLEEVASSNDIALMERPYLSQLTPDFKIGVAYHGTFAKYGYSTNVYNMREAADGEDRPTDAGVGVVVRNYIAPINDKTVAVHLGADFGFARTDTDGYRVRVSPLGRAQEFRDGEEFRFELFDRRDDAASITHTVFEAAAINGPLTLQAEYLFGNADTKRTAKDDFYTWYAQASYLVTGENREYDFRRGRIERPKPSREAGAIEVAARYQKAERKDEDDAILTATEFGVTYYANLNVRFMMNYGWADNQLNNDKPRLLSARAQFDF